MSYPNSRFLASHKIPFIKMIKDQKKIKVPRSKVRGYSEENLSYILKGATPSKATGNSKYKNRIFAIVPIRQVRRKPLHKP